MGLETGTTIASLNASWPLGTDQRNQGDDHIRLTKSVMKADALSKAQATEQGLAGRINFTGGVRFNNATVTNSQDLSKHIDLFGGLYGFNVTSGGNTGLNYDADAAGSHFFWSGTELNVKFFADGGIQFPKVYTTTSASAAHLAASGLLYRVTSALKYKERVEDLGVSVDSGAVVDGLRPVTFYPKGLPQARSAEYVQTIGIIADEAVEVVPELGTFDGGEVDGFQYERLPVVLLDEVRKLRQRVATLEAGR